jgi:hypothetical protein
MPGRRNCDLAGAAGAGADAAVVVDAGATASAADDAVVFEAAGSSLSLHLPT